MLPQHQIIIRKSISVCF